MHINSTHRKLLITVAVPIVRHLIDEYVSDDVKDEVEDIAGDDQSEHSYGKFVVLFAILGAVAFFLSRKSTEE